MWTNAQGRDLTMPPRLSPHANRHVLYESGDQRVFLIDIPASIEVAQAYPPGQSRLVLSSQAPSRPYASTEPKTAAANISNYGIHDPLHSHLVSIIREALEEIKEHMGRSRLWCLPRQLADSQSIPRKRSLDDEKSTDCEHDADREGRSEATSTTRFRFPDLYQEISPVDFKTGAYAVGAEQRQRTDQLTNINGSSTVFAAPVAAPEGEFSKFFIPPDGGCLVADVREAHDLKPALEQYFKTKHSNNKFDFILLDPPWPNRSARRKQAYRLAESFDAIENLLHCLDLDKQLGPEGYIGIWITNKAAWRQLVLGSGGLFEAWGVTHCEEWIWVKVASSGEPLTALDGVWRKPYEVLVIGRAGDKTRSRPVRSDTIKRRMIAAVPDLHSRKPCLKDIIQRTLFVHKPHYVALEVFARYMVAGWFAWGNEALKFNYNHYSVAAENKTPTEPG